MSFYLPIPDPVQLNRITWRMAAGLAAAFALLAILLHQQLLPWFQAAPPQTVAKQDRKVSNSLAFVDVTRRIHFCAQHVTPERSFVVFHNGSCVIVDEPSEDPIGEAAAIMRNSSGPEARFITRRIEHGHLMVTYRDPVFHCLFQDEIARVSPGLEESFQEHLAPSERRTMPPGWSPPDDAKLGLLTRTSLNQDAAELKVVKVIRSRPIPEHPAPPASLPPAPLPPASAPPFESDPSLSSLEGEAPPAPLPPSPQEPKLAP